MGTVITVKLLYRVTITHLLPHLLISILCEQSVVSNVDGVRFAVFPEVEPNENARGIVSEVVVVVVDRTIHEATSPKENVGGFGEADDSADRACPSLMLNSLFGVEVDGSIVLRLDEAGCTVISVFDGTSEKTVDGEENRRKDRCLA